MTSSPWSLVLPVLVTGLAFGVAWVLWWRRSSAPRPTSVRDRELLLADLEARQEVLYEELRRAGEAERPELELAAARNLRAIEEAGGGSDRRPAADVEGTEDKEAAPPTAVAGEQRQPRRAPSAWLGFVGGVACASLIGMLIVWAQRDARPREDAGPQPMQAAGAEHPPGAQLEGRDAEALEQLARAVDSDPTDIMARKEYAVGLLSTGQFLPAFEQAEILLASDERDPDGLYVAGMVRMRMGQEEAARDLLGRLIQGFPDHVPALTALGVLELRASGLEAAEVLWDRALAASGGRSPEIEQLVATARERFAGSATGGPAMSAAPAAPAAPRPAPAPSADAYNLRLELAEGVSVPPGAVLFIALRKGDVGPPAAARRIPGPRFPLSVSLSATDSMLGRPLPTDALVWARLDSDGSASTREDDEPFAETMLEIGASAVLTLQ